MKRIFLTLLLVSFTFATNASEKSDLRSINQVIAQYGLTEDAGDMKK